MNEDFESDPLYDDDDDRWTPDGRPLYPYSMLGIVNAESTA